MASTNATIGRDLRRLFDGGAVAGLGEAQLLDHVARRDALAESAFEAILTRHGPVVLACCRRVLGDSALAEDAFQATFLVLFRRAGSIRVDESLAPWLLHVARRAALKAREGEDHRRARERSAARPEAVVPEATISDLRLLVRAEVDRLPAKYRDPVRLCYFEDRTHDDAASALGWPVGTVHGRLSRARAMLRKRLMRRGVGITPLALSAVLVRGGDARAEIPRALCEATLDATSRSAVTRAGVVSLAAAVARGLALTTAIKAAAVVLAVVTLISAAAGITVLAGRDGKPQSDPEPAKGEAAVRAHAVDRYGDPLPKGAIARLGTIRFRHHGGNMVGGRAFLTPDGKILVTACVDGEARAWDLATGRLVRSIEAGEAALSPDGRTLFAAEPGVLRALDFSNGSELRRAATDSKENVDQLVVSPGGKSLALLVSQRVPGKRGIPQRRSTLTLYDAATLTKKWRLENDGRFVRDVAFSRDARLLALAGPDEEPDFVLTEPMSGSIRLYEVEGGTEVRQIAISGFGVASVAFAPDGKTLAAGVGDRTVRLYDLVTGQERLPRLGREGALPPRKKGENLHKGYDKAWAAACLAFSPDGSLLASGVEGIGWFNHVADVPPITLWDIAAAQEVRKFAGHPVGTISLSFSPDGKTLASSGFEPEARIWDVATGREVDRRPAHATSIQGLAVSPVDGTVFTFSLADGPILHWNPADGRLLEAVGVYPNVINNLAISPVGRTLLLLDADPGHGSVLWDVTGRTELQRLANDERVSCGHAAFSPDGRTVTAQHRVWDVATGRRLISFTKANQDSCISSYSADGRQVITVDSHGARTWDIASGAEVRRVPLGGTPTAWNAAISPDGRLVAVGQSRVRSIGALGARQPPDGLLDRMVDQIRIWELASGKEVAALFGQTGVSSGLAFSPDGRTLAAVSGRRDNQGDPGLRVWDVASGSPLRRFKNHPGGGYRIAYLPDGRSIVTASEDGTALVWDVSDLADRRPPEPPVATALEALWSDLASDDAPRAHRASWSLSVAGAVPFLRDRLRPARRNEPATGPELLRSLRAIAALERIGNPQARDVLESVARGAPTAPATQGATAALFRLSRTRPHSKSHPPASATTR